MAMFRTLIIPPRESRSGLLVVANHDSPSLSVSSQVIFFCDLGYRIFLTFHGPFTMNPGSLASCLRRTQGACHEKG